jgi:hypothetical protein
MREKGDEQRGDERTMTREPTVTKFDGDIISEPTLMMTPSELCSKRTTILKDVFWPPHQHASSTDLLACKLPSLY